MPSMVWNSLRVKAVQAMWLLTWQIMQLTSVLNGTTTVSYTHLVPASPWVFKSAMLITFFSLRLLLPHGDAGTCLLYTSLAEDGQSRNNYSFNAEMTFYQAGDKANFRVWVSLLPSSA